MVIIAEWKCKFWRNIGSKEKQKVKIEFFETMINKSSVQTNG